MTKKKPIKDEAGVEWQARSDAAWAAALKAADGDATKASAMYSRRRRDATDDPETAGPALPPFDDEKADSVSRRVFGRYVEDRDAGMVHDVQRAEAGCKIDRIANATFYHFGHEVPDSLDRHDCVET